MTTENPDPAGSYLIAARHAFLGEREKALAVLEKACDGRDFLAVFLKADPVFDDLRDEPRCREILRKMDLL